MEVKRIEIPPVPVKPEVKFVITLSENEAKSLAVVLGAAGWVYRLDHCIESLLNQLKGGLLQKE